MSAIKILRRAEVEKNNLKTQHQADDQEITFKIDNVAIAQYPNDSGYYLFYYDANGNELTDTYHDSLEQALEQAEFEFGIKKSDWKTVNETKSMHQPDPKIADAAKK